MLLSMIQVINEQSKITLKGHAKYAPYGYDIVCSAVSTLVYTFQESIEKLTEDTVGFSYGIDETVICYDVVSCKTKLLIESFLLGLKLIAQNYPNNVSVVEA